MNTAPISSLQALRQHHSAGATIPAIPSDVLFQSGQEVMIRHDGQEYRLRITRQNKLILTK